MKGSLSFPIFQIIEETGRRTDHKSDGFLNFINIKDLTILTEYYRFLICRTCKHMIINAAHLSS